MIGLVLVTHGRLAEELRLAMEHVVGPQRHVETVCIGPDDDVEGRRAEVTRCVNTVDTGDGVVLLTDMFGGTPSNLAISQMDRGGVEVIAGVNLPMLVKLAKVRSSQLLADACECAQSAGRKYIAAASDVIGQCRAVGDGPVRLALLNGATVNGATVNGVHVNGTHVNGGGVVNGVLPGLGLDDRQVPLGKVNGSGG